MGIVTRETAQRIVELGDAKAAVRSILDLEARTKSAVVRISAVSHSGQTPQVASDVVIPVGGFPARAALGALEDALAAELESLSARAAKEAEGGR